MNIVPVTKENEIAWAELCQKLWPDAQNILNERLDSEYLYIQNGKAVAFINLSLRHDYVEGTDSSPVGYIEGIYVVPEFRKMGIARELISFAKNWSLENGCIQLASDCELKNDSSRTFHKTLGFEETGIIVCFKMDLKNKNS